MSRFPARCTIRKPISRRPVSAIRYFLPRDEKRILGSPLMVPAPGGGARSASFRLFRPLGAAALQATVHEGQPFPVDHRVATLVHNPCSEPDPSAPRGRARILLGDAQLEV